MDIEDHLLVPKLQKLIRNWLMALIHGKLILDERLPISESLKSKYIQCL